MATVSDVMPVKYFVALLKGLTPPARVLEDLAASWGPIEYASREYPFDQTNYYEAEMGPGLQRQLLTFATLRSPEDLAVAKLRCNAIEDHHRVEGKRLFNLDIGYLDHNKIVLASVKGLGQKIYLSHGIFADLVARYKHGRYQPFEWTFPDFKEGRYDSDLGHIRQVYLDQLKAQRG
jgi:hypothetical protein